MANNYYLLAIRLIYMYNEFSNIIIFKKGNKVCSQCAAFADQYGHQYSQVRSRH